MGTETHVSDDNLRTALGNMLSLFKWIKLIILDLEDTAIFDHCIPRAITF